MPIKAKVTCSEVTKCEGNFERVKLRAVCGASPEDNSYSKYTPTANFELTITNPDAMGFFVPGKNYYVDFTPAES